MENSNIKIKSLGKFMDAVNKIQSLWTEEENGEFVFPWFRGHANADFKLLPSLYRNEKLRDNEDSYRHDFSQKGYPYLSDTAFGVPESDWDWYFLMQHYGLPTRLLDWTEGSLIALYFALFYKADEDDSDPCVWMLNPFQLNKILHETDQIFVFNDKIVKSYLPEIWSSGRPPKNPIALQPFYKSKRIAAQKGNFTIHGNEDIPLDELEKLNPCLIKLTINYHEIDLIKDELLIAGITESSLFPELSGLARELKEYWR
jgi:FRG domain